MRELIQKIMDPLLDLGPVLHPAMQLENVLAQPAPQFLDGIELRGIGGQPYRFNPRGARQGGQHVRVRVNVPVILDHREPVRRRIGMVQLGVELDHLLSPHDVTIQVVPLPRYRVEGTNSAPLLIVARALRHRLINGAAHDLVFYQFKQLTGAATPRFF